MASTVQQEALLEQAKDGDETAYERLVEPHRGELHAHCYRMLGSVHDAEDALQEALLRSWRHMSKFEQRSSLRSWLYRIATNTCLDTIEKRPKQRVLPIDYGPPSDPHGGPGEPIVESIWIDPYPDEQLGVEEREAVELAFIAALQHLPPNQRAVLILREVLGFSAKEVAETLDTTVASVNSAMQRARAAVDERTPEQSQQETLRSLGDEEMRELVERYVDAWHRADVDAIVSMLTEDACFAMPPLASWFGGPEGGREEIGAFLTGYPLSGKWRWRTILTSANGQPAIAFYIWDPDAEAHLPFALNVLTLKGERISDVTAFVSRSVDDPDADYERWPDRDIDPDQLFATFGAFGLPEKLD